VATQDQPALAFFRPTQKHARSAATGEFASENRRDEVRDAYLTRQGWTVRRFWNHEVMRNREGVLATILARAGTPW
jgi:very-short-patch-repair endonuclease